MDCGLANSPTVDHISARSQLRVRRATPCRSNHVLSLLLPCEAIVCKHVLLNRLRALLNLRQCCVRSSLTTNFADLQLIDACNQIFNGVFLRYLVDSKLASPVDFCQLLRELFRLIKSNVQCASFNIALDPTLI